MGMRYVRFVVYFTMVFTIFGLLGCAGTYGPSVDQTQLEYDHREASTMLEMARELELASDERVSEAENLFNETFEQHKNRPRNELADQYKKVSRNVRQTIASSLKDLRAENASLRETVQENEEKISMFQKRQSRADSPARIEDLGETIARLREDRDRFWELAHSRGDTIHKLQSEIQDLRENHKKNDTVYADTIISLRAQRDQYRRRTRILGDTLQRFREKLTEAEGHQRHLDAPNMQKIPLEIQFDRKSTRLKPAFQRDIDEVIDQLTTNDTDLIFIVGHTDSDPVRKGDELKSNWELSFRRALSVLEYLVYVKDIPKERVLPIGAADLFPKSTNETAEGRRENRRVEVYLRPSEGFLQ